MGADTFVRAGDASTGNYGDEPKLVIKNAGSGALNTRKSYARFDLSEVNTTIVDAELIFTTGFVSDKGCNPGGLHVINVFGLNDGVDGESWLENEITWNNAPANNNSGAGLTSDATFLGTYSQRCNSLGDKICFSNADFVDFLANDTNSLATLIFTDATGVETGTGPATKENKKYAAPVLRIFTNQIGDVNLDGDVNLLDVSPFINRISNGEFQCEADCNQDGAVNLLDVDPFIAILGGG